MGPKINNESSFPFREILAPDLDIVFSAQAEQINDWDALAAWVAGPASSVDASRHVLHDFTYEALGDNRYGLVVEMAWDGILPDGVRMEARTRHTWTIVDDPSERFARIQKIRVEQVEPFTVVQD